MDYLGYWNFSERPFENNRNSNFFYPGKHHIEALERLLYIVKDGNMHFGMITGEVGAGKTMVINQFIQRLEENKKYIVMHLPNGNMDYRDIMCEIIYRINRKGTLSRSRRDLLSRMSKYEILSKFNDLLETKVTRLGKLMVIVIDEAQQLSEETLIELKNLTNLGCYDTNSITIVLSGQPELADQIGEIPAIDQRIGLRYHLPYLTENAVSEYLDYRLKAAGCRALEVFSSDSKEVIYDYTGGTPREINRICKLALDRSYSLGQKNVSPNIIKSIVVDIFNQNAMVG